MRRPLTIAFFGSSLVSAYWNGAATYYRGIIRALACRGHLITFFEPDAYERQAHRDIPDPSWARVQVYSSHDEVGVRTCLQRAREADVVVKASGVGIFDDLLEAEIAAIGNERRLAVFWDVDAPATLSRLDAHKGDPLTSLVPRFGLVLTYGGGDEVVRRYKALGARDCVPIYNALDPTTHHRVAPEARYACDLAFLGNRLPDREDRYKQFFLAAANRRPGERFLLGGAGWDPHELPANVGYLGHVYTHEHNGLNSSSRLVLNISRSSMATFGFSPATRVFEAAGAAACIVTDAWAGIENFLYPGEEILVADDGEAVAEFVREIPAPRARAIGNAALRRVLTEHTYEQRAARVEALFHGC